MVQYKLRIPARESRLRGVLFELNCISTEAYAEDGDWLVDIRMPSSDWNRLEKRVDKNIATYIVQH